MFYNIIITFFGGVVNAFVMCYNENNKSDEYLEEHDFSRDEVKSGLIYISKRYGVDGLADLFL